MYSRIFIQALLVSGAMAVPELFRRKDTCNADNCLRAIRGTSGADKPSITQRVADCDAFFATPSPTSVPSYAAKACGGNNLARYSSACSCAGFTTSPTSTPTPTGGSPPPGSVCSTFYVQATNAPSNYEGKFVRSDPGDGTQNDPAELQLNAASKQDATKYTLVDPNGLVGEALDPSTVWASSYGDYANIDLDNRDSIPPYSPQPSPSPVFGQQFGVYCKIPTEDGSLQGALDCQYFFSETYIEWLPQVCSGFGDEVITDLDIDNGCQGIELVAVPACG